MPSRPLWNKGMDYELIYNDASRDGPKNNWLALPIPHVRLPAGTAPVNRLPVKWIFSTMDNADSLVAEGYNVQNAVISLPRMPFTTPAEDLISGPRPEAIVFR